MSVSVQLSTTGIVLLILALIILSWSSRRARPPLPPGPKGWPLIGNLLDIPMANFGATYTKWAQKYGQYYRSLYRCVGTTDQD